MNKNLQIIAVVITLFGLGFMGYSDGKGWDNYYGQIIMFVGVALSISIKFFGKKDK